MDIQNELTATEREQVANRLVAEQRDRFGGIRKAAYTAAGVNPATWARATSGQRVRPDRLVRIVQALWPDSHGKWSKVPQAESESWARSHQFDEEEKAQPVEFGHFIERMDEVEDRLQRLERLVLHRAAEQSGPSARPVALVANEGEEEQGPGESPESEHAD